MHSPLLRSIAAVAAVATLAGPAVAQPTPSPQLPARILAFEARANAGQPPDKVMDAVGVKPGMVIGELGAGRGRYTVHLAARVGPRGKVFANDIDAAGLAFIRDRCAGAGITNVETILGKVDDPLFPAQGLDMVFMVWVYHMLDQPRALLKNIVPALKPGATIVMMEPIPSETEAEIKEVTARTGRKPTDINVVTGASLEDDARTAGLEIVKAMEGFLKADNIYILRRR